MLLTCAGTHAALLGDIVVLVSSAASVGESFTAPRLAVVVPVSKHGPTRTGVRLCLTKLWVRNTAFIRLCWRRSSSVRTEWNIMDTVSLGKLKTLTGKLFRWNHWEKDKTSHICPSACATITSTVSCVSVCLCVCTLPLGVSSDSKVLSDFTPTHKKEISDQYYYK